MHTKKREEASTIPHLVPERGYALVLLCDLERIVEKLVPLVRRLQRITLGRGS